MEWVLGTSPTATRYFAQPIIIKQATCGKTENGFALKTNGILIRDSSRGVGEMMYLYLSTSG